MGLVGGDVGASMRSCASHRLGELVDTPVAMTEKPIFGTVTEALLALSMDKLGTVYYRANSVFVVTAHGSGTFPIQKWREARGPAPSIAPEVRA